MGKFFVELKRRHIYRVAAAYAVLAWLLLQIVNNVAPVLDLPTWIARAILLLLVIGFPVAMLLAWIVESPARNAESSPRAAGKADWVIVGALTIVIAILVYQQVVPRADVPASASAA